MASGTTGTLNAVWGVSGQDVFAVGSRGAIVHFDGGSWVPMYSNTVRPLHAVWGASALDVFVASGLARVFHYGAS